MRQKVHKIVIGNISKIFVCLLLPLLFGGCSLLDYHPYDVLVSGPKDLTKKNIALIEERLEGKKTIKFAVISDTQRWYDGTIDAVRHINARGDIDFVIHAGDQSDFGVTDEFEKMRDICNGLQMPWVVLLGNHDCLGTGKQAYERIYGAVNFAFTAGDVRFICLNTNALEYDYSEPVPDFEFMEEQIVGIADTDKKSVYVMHVKPFGDEFNNNVADVFEEYVKRTNNIQFCINGHGHHLEVEEPFNDGIIYYGCPCIDSRIYFVFTITPEGYTYEEVHF